jgi:hypothetical protein
MTAGTFRTHRYSTLINHALRGNQSDRAEELLADMETCHKVSEQLRARVRDPQGKYGLHAKPSYNQRRSRHAGDEHD